MTSKGTPLVWRNFIFNWYYSPIAEDYRHLSMTLQRLTLQQAAETFIQFKVVTVGTSYVFLPDIGMNVSDRTQAVVKALRRGLVHLVEEP